MWSDSTSRLLLTLRELRSYFALSFDSSFYLAPARLGLRLYLQCVQLYTHPRAESQTAVSNGWMTVALSLSVDQPVRDDRDRVGCAGAGTDRSIETRVAKGEVKLPIDVGSEALTYNLPDIPIWICPTFASSYPFYAVLDGFRVRCSVMCSVRFGSFMVRSAQDYGVQVQPSRSLHVRSVCGAVCPSVASRQATTRKLITSPRLVPELSVLHSGIGDGIEHLPRGVDDKLKSTSSSLLRSQQT